MGRLLDEYKANVRDREARRAAMSPEERRRSDFKMGLAVVVALFAVAVALGGQEAAPDATPAHDQVAADDPARNDIQTPAGASRERSWGEIQAEEREIAAARGRVAQEFEGRAARFLEAANAEGLGPPLVERVEYRHNASSATLIVGAQWLTLSDESRRAAVRRLDELWRAAMPAEDRDAAHVMILHPRVGIMGSTGVKGGPPIIGVRTRDMD
ncbi:MAG: hypothetical protein K8I02_07165 [Candidatus Methylomirabilis sp.]|nr:hypothetical protein [Deltaproteobacteria bacterium]